MLLQTEFYDVPWETLCQAVDCNGLMMTMLYISYIYIKQLDISRSMQKVPANLYNGEFDEIFPGS